MTSTCGGRDLSEDEIRAAIRSAKNGPESVAAVPEDAAYPGDQDVDLDHGSSTCI
jgi:hypothetical protein